ncbi:hypothetical protein ABGB16_16045 [Micromonospora sp. B11E3]|uniref:hypothetical protein n=1 Tax=Micromonospora sp. B11E3 TaxID=3153562 RepID=UPI00325E72A0
MSTKEFQDRLSSTRWQRDFAEGLVEGRGVIVAEFFDADCSRRLPWPRRPQAARLLAALADPDRGFDAIAVGEFERAFYGDQVRQLAPLFKIYSVEVWLPELNGPVDATNEFHLSLLAVLGVHSKREIQRSRFRAIAAMRAQVIEQGRHLGGRPPYGYRLVDAGPHPNRTHARWGRRKQCLEPDPATAPWVKWISAQRLAGRASRESLASSTSRGCPAHPATTGPATRTATARPGRCARRDDEHPSVWLNVEALARLPTQRAQDVLRGHSGRSGMGQPSQQKLRGIDDRR